MDTKDKSTVAYKLKIVFCFDIQRRLEPSNLNQHM